MKVIAWHLPQFHEIEENNTWWGKGFTEWVNVRKAKPLFPNHNQPRVPLNRNYYNLLDKNTLEWQAELAKKHGVYGFCFYQYWFNGKKLLEKPIENLLKWKDIDLKFCLSWANEPWTRAWDGGDKEVLMPQNYGDESEWAYHFDYLKPYFIDDRYIKVENKPVYLIYRSNNIPDFERMISFWDIRAKECGFNGLHIVETLNVFQKERVSHLSSASVIMEPMYSIGWEKPFKDKLRNFVLRKTRISDLSFYNYRRLWNQILRRPVLNDIYQSAFVDWDNSARKKNATIITGVSPKLFAEYFSKLAKRNSNNDFLFINAWNEWAEGTYLEPDIKNGFNYLQSVEKAIKKCH